MTMPDTKTRNLDFSNWAVILLLISVVIGAVSALILKVFPLEHWDLTGMLFVLCLFNAFVNVFIMLKVFREE